jgi:hypothetical protein
LEELGPGNLNFFILVFLVYFCVDNISAALMFSLFDILTINVPVVYMARYIMVLRRARSITRGIGRGGP